MMIVAGACSVAVAALIATMVDAALAFPRLPPRVPLHFDLRGKPGTFGPKAVLVGIFVAIALLVAVQLAGVATAGKGELRVAAALDAAATLVFLAFTERAVFDAVLNRGGRLAVGPFYVSMAALIATYAVAARL